MLSVNRFELLFNECSAAPELIVSADFFRRVEELRLETSPRDNSTNGDQESRQSYLDRLVLVERLRRMLLERDPESHNLEALEALLSAVHFNLQDNAKKHMGYAVQPLTSFLPAHKRSAVTTFEQTNNTGELALIDAVGDGNCGPRAVIQGLLIQGLVTQQARFVCDFLRNIYVRQGGHVDLANRNLYGCILRRKSHLPEDLALYANSCIWVGNELNYIDFNNQIHPLLLANTEQFALDINRMCSLDVDTQSVVRLSFDEINAFLQEPSDIFAASRVRMIERLMEFFRAYETSSINDLPVIRDLYFGGSSDNGYAAYDDVIYVLAGCLRFDIHDHLLANNETYESGLGLGATYGDERLAQLGYQMDPQVGLSYFSQHGIFCRIYGSTTLSPDPLNLISPNPQTIEMFPQAAPPENPIITIDIYRPGAHFMTMVRESTDRVNKNEMHVEEPVLDKKVLDKKNPKKQTHLPAPTSEKPVSPVAPAKDRTNYVFLMAVLAKPVVKALAIVLLLASLLLLGLMMTGFLPFTVGVVTTGISLMAGLSFFAGNYAAQKSINIDIQDNSASTMKV